MYRTGTATVALASHLVCSSALILRGKGQQARALANPFAPLPNKQKRPSPHVAAVRSGISDGDAETFRARCMALIRYASHVVTVCRFPTPGRVVIRPQLAAQKNLLICCYCSLLCGNAAAPGRFFCFCFFPGAGRFPCSPP